MNRRKLIGAIGSGLMLPPLARAGLITQSGSRLFTSGGGDPDPGDGDTVTITGSGFGTKSPAAPHYFQRFTGLADGANYAAAGMDFLGLNTTNAASQVRTDNGFNNGPSWRTVVAGNGTDETFTHWGVFMPAENDRVTCMFWRKMVRTGTGAGTGQIKGTRCGRAGSDTGPSDGNAMYSATPKWASSWYPNTTNINTALGAPDPHYWTAGGSETNISRLTNEEPYLLDGNHTWHYTYMQLNTIGSANGIFVIRHGKKLYLNNTTQQIKSASSHYLDYCQPNPGYANTGFINCGFNVYHSYVYIDNSRAWAGIGDASTFSNCEGFIPIDLESWSDTEVVGNLGGLGLPDGYDWAYVMDASGNVNSSGMSFTRS
jgi:hypothetical protein